MTKLRTQELWLAVRLLDLPLTALGIHAREEPVVVSHKQRVVYANAPARRNGIELEMDITTASVLAPCEQHEREPKLEQQALVGLCDALYQFTPHIRQYQSDLYSGLLLEISRCLKLFSGLARLTSQIQAHMDNTGYGYDCGMAHTATGAWLLCGQPLPSEPPPNPDLFNQRLKRLPVTQLEGHPKAVASLNKSGFVTLGDIAKQIDAQTISSVKKRYGQAFTQHLCGIFGIEHDFRQRSLFQTPAHQYQPETFFYDTLQFDYPVSQVAQLYPALDIMLGKLADYLRQRQLECQRIEWRLFDIHQNLDTLTVVSDHPQSQTQLLSELSRIRLEHHTLPFEVDTLELHCRHTTALQSQSRAQTLDFEAGGNRRFTPQDFSLTAAKLKARLGEHAVFKVSYRDSHIPEESNESIGLGETCNENLPDTHRLALRPSWLFDTPFAIQQRARGLYWRGYLQLLSGPERIDNRWWDTPVARDYYLARREDGLRVWVFQERSSQRWYAQGVFA